MCEAVQLLVSRGHEVWVETGAGDSEFSDNEYSEHGAKIVYDSKEVFQANIILKGSHTLEEVDLMKKANINFSSSDSYKNKAYFQYLLEEGNGFGL